MVTLLLPRFDPEKQQSVSSGCGRAGSGWFWRRNRCAHTTLNDIRETQRFYHGEGTRVYSTFKLRFCKRLTCQPPSPNRTSLFARYQDLSVPWQWCNFRRRLCIERNNGWRKCLRRSLETHEFIQTLLFFSRRHFGHLSHSCVKTHRNSVHWPIFSDILTEMT